MIGTFKNFLHTCQASNPADHVHRHHNAKANTRLSVHIVRIVHRYRSMILMCALHSIRDLQDPELPPIEQEYFSLLPKTEVCKTTRYEDLTKQDAIRTPDTQSIAACRVNIASIVTAKTIGYTDICHGEYAAIDEKLGLAALFDVVGVSTLVSYKNGPELPVLLI
jgi:hypothetical protein